MIWFWVFTMDWVSNILFISETHMLDLQFAAITCMQTSQSLYIVGIVINTYCLLTGTSPDWVLPVICNGQMKAFSIIAESLRQALSMIKNEIPSRNAHFLLQAPASQAGKSINSENKTEKCKVEFWLWQRQSTRNSQLLYQVLYIRVAGTLDTVITGKSVNSDDSE